MKFYHGTSIENYITIQKEGMLYGRRVGINGKEINRCTYLTTDIDSDDLSYALTKTMEE